MPDQSCSCLPDKSSWCFDEIENSDSGRASALEAAGSPDALLSKILYVLDSALKRNDVRFGCEHAEARWEDCRAVLQFKLGTSLFDWFFNARIGYRAHFRAHKDCGLQFNRQIIEALCRHLNSKLPDFVSGLELDSNFKSCGNAQIAKQFLLDSLNPELSKVWYCAKRIQPDGRIDDLALGLGGPGILLDQSKHWSALYPEDNSAWVDVKGAFLGESGPYQIKDPQRRAKELHNNGAT